ncbi:MAG: hypothetical protein KGI84_08185, partial [Elusimicrobia bacterium]|nr:hypothetical protein [Elusimicrobiota bacterium]
MHKKNLGALAVFGLAAVLSFSARAQSVARYGNVSVLLPNGEVLIAGGVTDNTGYGTATSEAELLLPDGTFQTINSMNSARYDATGTLLPDGTVLVAGGVNALGTVLKTVEIYNPATGNWATSALNVMSVARFAHTATLMRTGFYSGDVLLCGGFNDTTYSGNTAN